MAEYSISILLTMIIFQYPAAILALCDSPYPIVIPSVSFRPFPLMVSNFFPNLPVHTGIPITPDSQNDLSHNEINVSRSSQIAI